MATVSPTPAQESTPEANPSVEPQASNPLTKKFTDPERAAVNELRTILPLILEEVFPDKPDAGNTPFEIWGVHIDPSRVDDARTDVVLVKFLRARSLDVTAASEMLKATLKWRAEFKAVEAANESFPEDVFGAMGHIFGKDKEGRPVTYNVYGGGQDLKKVFGDIDRFLRWRVGLMERSLREVDFINVDSMVQVHDYEGVSMTSRDAESKRAASEASKLFGDYYPELLSAKFFVNVPTIFTWVFWLFKSVIPAQTFSKMKMVGTGPETVGASLLPLISSDQLPKRYGGEAEAF